MRRARPLLPLIVVLPLVAHAVVSLTGVGDDLYPWADHAVVEIETGRAADGDQQLGTYSRFRWNHPGPALHYAMAPLYVLTGRDPAALNAAAALLNAVAAAGVVLVALLYGGRLTALWAAALVGLLAVQLDVHVLRDFWFPHAVILPFALFATLAAAMAAGALRLLPAVAAVGSFVVQAQIGLAPAVACLTLAALIPAAVTAVRERRVSQPRWPYAAAAAVVAVMWAPPVYEELTTEPGNLAQLRGFFTSTDGSHGPHDAIDAVANVVSVPVLGSYSTFGLAVPARSGALLVLCALAALLVLSAIVGLRRGRRFAASLSLLSLLAIAVQCFAVTNVREELHAHVVLWFSGIGVPALMGIGAALAPELRAVPARLAEVALVLAVAAVTAVGAVEVADNPRLEWAANGGGDYAYEGRIEPLWRQVDAYTGSHSISNPAVAMATRDRWLYAAGVIARLRERGDRVRVDPAWAFMFGDRLKADGREDATLFFAAPGPPPPLPPGARVAASTPDATVYAVIRAPAAPSRE